MNKSIYRGCSKENYKWTIFKETQKEIRILLEILNKKNEIRCHKVE